MLWVLLFVLLVPSILAATVVVSACMLSSRISDAEGQENELQTIAVYDEHAGDSSSVRTTTVLPRVIQPAELDRPKKNGAPLRQGSPGSSSRENETIPFPTPTT